MAHDDMNHMRHLESVALSDCAVLETKESSYQGSWKRAGGRSAWFMGRRNLDRLITLMGKPEMPIYFNLQNVDDTIKSVTDANSSKTNVWNIEFPGSKDATVEILRFLRNSFVAEDIFAKIMEKPGGEDGTVLACLRDARRYFMLIEAEMIAEGVVECETKTYEGNAYPVDVYTMIADETGLPRDEVKRRCLEACYSNPPPEPRVTTKDATFAKPYAANGGYAAEQARRHPERGPPWLDKIGAVLTIGDTCTWMRPPDNTVFTVEFFEVQVGLPVVRGEGLPPEGKILDDWSQLRRDSRIDRKAHVVSDGGSQHAAALAPWQVDQLGYDLLRQKHGALVDLFYTKRASGVWQLESVVGAHNCPKELYPVYVLHESNKWAIKRNLVPAELNDNFPMLQREQNDKEHDETNTDFKFMYEWHESAQKWILRNAFAAWARDIG